MGFEPNNSDYEIFSERELSVVLSYFTPEMIETTIDNILMDKMRPYSYSIGNIVDSYETNYKMALSQYPNYAEELSDSRYRTYAMIIEKVCSYHNIGWNLDPNVDIYSAAKYIYRFLVSDFRKNIASFFTNYICHEKNTIYDSFEMGEMKKNKDSSSLYSRKVYKGAVNNKLSTIHANLDFVLEQLEGFDISLNIILSMVYGGTERTIGSFLESIIFDRGDYYKEHYIPSITGPGRPEMITNIRLQLQPVSAEIREFIVPQ